MSRKKKKACRKSSAKDVPLALLRAELARRGLDGFIVPHTDEYQNEHLPLHAERLAWLTGFTGSTGLALILAEKAALFTDGRYTLQIESQTDGALYERQGRAAQV